MLEFINLFMVPFIALGIIQKRKRVNNGFTETFLIRYALCVIAVYICTYLVMSITTLAVGIGGDSTSNLYLFVSIVVACILPYVYEICSKFVKVSLEVEVTENDSKEDN